MVRDEQAPPEAEQADTSARETDVIIRWSYRHHKTGKIIRAKDKPFVFRPRRKAQATEQLRLFPETPPTCPAKVRNPKRARGKRR